VYLYTAHLNKKSQGTILQPWCWCCHTATVGFIVSVCPSVCPSVRPSHCSVVVDVLSQSCRRGICSLAV